MALATAAGPTDVPLIDETIGENLEATTARFGDREALIVPHQGVRYTYAEFNDAVDIVARGLLAGGLNVGDRIGIWSPNNAEWVLIQYATAKIGAILVNINPAFRTSELEYTLNQSGCRFLISAGCGDRSLGIAPSGCSRPICRPADQHPVHERNNRLSQGGHAQPLQHPQQRVLRGRSVRI